MSGGLEVTVIIIAIQHETGTDMNLDRVSSGRDVPNDFNVIIEIPMNADPIKYEVDKETGAMFVDRFMATSMHYPCNYGYIPHTLSKDGDPVDVLVISPVPLISGVVVRCRALGMLKSYTPSWPFQPSSQQATNQAGEHRVVSRTGRPTTVP